MPEEESRNAFRPIEATKEIVIYRGGWGFVLPEKHSVAIDGSRHVMLDMPQRGGTYHLAWLDDSDTEELRVHLGPGDPLIGHALGDLEAGYPFPTIAQELDRLRNRWDAAGGPRWEDRIYGDPGTRARFELSGNTYDEQTTRMRKMVRALERGDDVTSM
jgi:hypothetical protein